MRAASKLYKRIRFIGSRGYDAARPVIFETAADDAYTVREQRGCKRVAFVPLKSAAIECEAQQTRSIDQPATRKPEWLRHARRGDSGVPEATTS
jgi:hypothetical protein